MPISRETDIAVKIIENADVTADLDHKIRMALVESFPHSADHFRKSRKWFSEPEWNVIAMAPEGEIAGNIAVIERTVVVGSDSLEVRVFGPQNVMVLPNWRKTGLLERMMNAVLFEAGQRGLEAGLLFCRQPLADKVYGPLGWKELHETVYLKREPDLRKPRPSHDLAMMYPLSVTRFPSGDIDLKGPDW